MALKIGCDPELFNISAARLHTLSVLSLRTNISGDRTLHQYQNIFEDNRNFFTEDLRATFRCQTRTVEVLSIRPFISQQSHARAAPTIIRSGESLRNEIAVMHH